MTSGRIYLEWFGQGIENVNEKEKEKELRLKILLSQASEITEYIAEYNDV